jgi:hypothetical protein
MSVDTLQSLLLVYRGQKVLKGAVWNGDEPEAPAQVKFFHVGPDQFDFFTDLGIRNGEFAPGHGEHGFVHLQTGDLDPGGSRGKENPAGTTSQFQHRGPSFKGRGHIELYVPLHSGKIVIVEPGVIRFHPSA